MDLSIVIDIALGLGFIYLFFSLICSGVMEWVARFVALRASTLEAGIRSMLNTTPAGAVDPTDRGATQGPEDSANASTTMRSSSRWCALGGANGC